MNDRQLLRELAERYLAICSTEDQQRKRRLWREHNSLLPTYPPIYVRAIPWQEVQELQDQQHCVDPLFRKIEDFFRQMLYRSTLGDDYIFEPWVTIPAHHAIPPEGIWGLPIRTIRTDEAGGSCRFDPPMKQLADAAKLRAVHHNIDEQTTADDVARLEEVIGDVLPIVVDRGPVYRMWTADIATMLAQLRGLEQIMWDMTDDPEWLHEVLAFMRDAVLTAHTEAEARGDWRLCAHQNQAMPYAQELPDPSASESSVMRKQLWVFCAAQEYTLVSPEMHDEFLLQYQLPIISQFGLVAYGCCEDLTNKIDLLRQIPNLRRIAVAPRADVRKCAMQIQGDYVFSWRPSPAEMVSCEFDPEHIRAVTRNAIEACREYGCQVDITLKDVETVQGDPTRLREWVTITRSVLDRYY